MNNEQSNNIEIESFVYKGITLQRLTKDGLWYAIHNNKIIEISQYRNDILAWIDYYYT